MVSEKTGSEKPSQLLEATHLASVAAQTGIQVCSGAGALGHVVPSLWTDTPADTWGSRSHEGPWVC